MGASVVQNYSVLGQAPLDAKLIFKNKEQFFAFTESNPYFAYDFYKGMTIYLQLDEEFYIWENVFSPNYQNNKKLLPENFVYPDGVVYNDLDYSNLSFNFVMQEYQKADIGEWTGNSETLPVVEIQISQLNIADPFFPTQITQVFPNAERIVFTGGVITGLLFDGIQVELFQELSLENWDSLSYTFQYENTYTQEAYIQVLAIGESLEYNETDESSGSGFKQIGIVDEDFDNKKKSSIYFARRGEDTFDIIVVDRNNIPRKFIPETDVNFEAIRQTFLGLTPEQAQELKQILNG